MHSVAERVESLDEKFAAFTAWAQVNARRTDAMLDEMRREARQHTLEWAQMAERFGRFAEDIVAPNIPRIGREVFGITEVSFSAQRVDRRHSTNPARFREFDLVHAGQGKVILVETKATARLKYFDAFAEVVSEFADYWPEMKDFVVIPIFASLALSPDFVRRLTRLRIYGMALGERTMELVNLAGVSARRR